MKKIEKFIESHGVMFTFFVGTSEEIRKTVYAFEKEGLKFGKKKDGIEPPTEKELEKAFNISGATFGRLYDSKRGCRMILSYVNSDICKTKANLIHTTCHELRHVVDTLVTLKGLRFEDRENTALVSGWLGCEFICAVLDYCKENKIK